ncbi:hypothetical protein FT663_04033 [Candidozyma haemuli var. vulneris]|uniref:Uncharacterized protein n=1 Tax=Candidozyma haemuli TaxID=45357 RepID=A0A2V1AQL7_9ASCO|nr:hypothetical protein CXQ85_003369 [[Candida] haemuloni]KAF3987212.1 hypothetical protein FT662_04114 [[Candida] haemuloni var. vulneris]KAF3988421.1 hypothetical protein FT663_04033 [[Candida] haemuloni var. vulneris]PVH19523.1 hypothetical protein CXQ85_003369 [[Candida] haemuloni]
MTKKLAKDNKAPRRQQTRSPTEPEESPQDNSVSGNGTSQNVPLNFPRPITPPVTPRHLTPNPIERPPSRRPQRHIGFQENLSRQRPRSNALLDHGTRSRTHTRATSQSRGRRRSTPGEQLITIRAPWFYNPHHLQSYFFLRKKRPDLACLFALYMVVSSYILLEPNMTEFWAYKYYCCWFKYLAWKDRNARRRPSG